MTPSKWQSKRRYKSHGGWRPPTVESGHSNILMPASAIGSSPPTAEVHTCRPIRPKALVEQLQSREANKLQKGVIIGFLTSVWRDQIDEEGQVDKQA